MSNYNHLRVLTRLALSVLGAAAASLALAQQETGPPIPANLDIQRIERDGISIEFRATPMREERDGILTEAEFANVEFKISSAENGEPLRGSYPGVWIDLVQSADGRPSGTALECRQRVSNYLQGAVGMRPLIDLNSYFVMVLNQDPSISVIDPVVGVTGITSLFTSIPLERPGADWTKTQDDRRLFVTMPRAGKVAVIDLETFKVVRNVDVGEMPMRAVIQPDQKYVWVGSDSASGGVTVIDTQTLEVVTNIATGAGHHELEFSIDSTRAYATNRDAGTVTIIDTAALRAIETVATGPVPISIAHSALSGSVYVADGRSGVVSVLDQSTGERRADIALEPGLGPMKISYDGRWGFVVNPEAGRVFIFDASTNELAQTVEIGDRPYQISLTDTFAYIRALDTERVSMINLQELNRGGSVVVNNFSAGTFPPSQVDDIRLADGMAPAAQESAVLVVSPADATVYYYMEGMNAPMGAFRNYGHRPRAVTIANRALKETQPGVYSTTLKLPLAGEFELAFLNEAPQILHCFTMNVAENPDIDRGPEPIEVEYLSDNTLLSAGDSMPLRFRLFRPGSGKVIDDGGAVNIKYFRVPRYDVRELAATHVGDGIYEAQLPFAMAGAYYIYIAAPELRLGYGDLNYRTVVVSQPRSAANDERETQ
ncbi:MAG TPA: YncE family protein [Gammaproteobacteria bacterium]|nr:YncE family protein [Gammaproteobacteria bacterium]